MRNPRRVQISNGLREGNRSLVRGGCWEGRDSLGLLALLMKEHILSILISSNFCRPRCDALNPTPCRQRFPGFPRILQSRAARPICLVQDARMIVWRLPFIHRVLYISRACTSGRCTRPMSILIKRRARRMVENASRTSLLRYCSSTASMNFHRYIANLIYPDTACPFASCRYSPGCVCRPPP